MSNYSFSTDRANISTRQTGMFEGTPGTEVSFTAKGHHRIKRDDIEIEVLESDHGVAVRATLKAKHEHKRAA